MPTEQTLSACDLIARHPHERFHRVTAEGYRFCYALCEPSGRQTRRRLKAYAYHGRVRVGLANFGSTGSTHEDGYHCQHVRVEADHQRRGIATALYLLAEVVLDRHLNNYWDKTGHQSEAARQLWNTPRRPFGNPQGPWHRLRGTESE